MLDKHINVCLYNYVLSTVKLMKLFSDATRLRILMLIARKELCVCQIMGVLCISQPLISRNLAILSNAGLIAERKEGKLVFYSLNREMPESYAKVIDLLKEMTAGDSAFPGDLHALKECEEFQKKTGKCDMKTFREFMARKSVKVCRRKD